MSMKERVIQKLATFAHLTFKTQIAVRCI